MTSGNGKRILVCGGRDFSDCDWIYRCLDRYVECCGPISMLIHGGATGADEIGAEWAKRNNVKAMSFPANWRKYGKRAGPLRNERMLMDGKPDVIIAFPGGKGTADMTGRAEGVIPIWRVTNEWPPDHLWKYGG